MNTLQEWYLINTSPDLSHPLHIHVNHFQVCKQSICWRRTVIHHKVFKTESWEVVSILKLLFVNLDWNKIFKLIIKLEKLSQILHMVWIFLAPICSLFPVWIKILGKVKTWFGNVWRNAIETQPENLMLFYSTTQSVQAIIVNRFLEKFLWPFFLWGCTINPKCCYQNVHHPNVAKCFLKMIYKFHPSTQNENIQLSTFSHISFSTESILFLNQMCGPNGRILHYQVRNTSTQRINENNSTKSRINRALCK